MSAAEDRLRDVGSHLIAACGGAAAGLHLAEPSNTLAESECNSLLGMAKANGVTTHLYQWVSRQRSIERYRGLRERLQPFCRSDALRRLALRAELVRILIAFEEAGIRVMTLKGPLWADRYHRSPELREFGDLDLLVRPDDRDRAWQLLLELGYHSPYQNHTLQERYHIVFHHLQSGEFVELHWRIAGPQFGAFHSGDFLWDGARQVPYLAKANSWEPTIEAALLYLAIHAYKHDWERLQWLLDLPELLRQPALDWDRLDATARSCAAHRLLRATLQLCWQVFPTCRRPDAGYPLLNHVLKPAQVSRVRRLMLRPAMDSERFGDFLWLRVANAETLGDRLRLLWHSTRVSDRDLDAIGHRPWLRPASSLFRPFRLLARALQGRSRDLDRTRRADEADR